MKKTIAKKWIAALRSGKYKQGRGGLQVVIDGERYMCCLGVLCDLHSKAHGLEWKPDADWGYAYDHSFSWLPKSVIEWAGIKTGKNPSIGQIGAGERNDEKGNSFKQIARAIERNIERI